MDACRIVWDGGAASRWRVMNGAASAVTAARRKNSRREKYFTTSLRRQFAKVNIFEPECVTMVLEFDLTAREDRQRAVPIIFHDGFAGDEFAVQKDLRLLAHHDNAETIPLADGFVRDLEGFAWA